MERMRVVFVSLLAAAALVASPVVAKTRHRTGVPCKRIQEEIASGKTADEVAKELKTSAARVKTCTTPKSAAKTTKPTK